MRWARVAIYARITRSDRGPWRRSGTRAFGCDLGPSPPRGRRSAPGSAARRHRPTGGATASGASRRCRMSAANTIESVFRAAGRFAAKTRDDSQNGHRTGAALRRMRFCGANELVSFMRHPGRSKNERCRIATVFAQLGKPGRTQTTPSENAVEILRGGRLTCLTGKTNQKNHGEPDFGDCCIRRGIRRIRPCPEEL